eukprot:TRINITY_DN3567_c0_g1_i1.p1 TRINITY_DN3567_c0_g1~~TRINITY_DN3567_c0_g1_i1.p1  ORF type:complete len:139 (+),score=11.13 TRINITY_DN3567_c0_g1_i1:143-559(+)
MANLCFFFCCFVLTARVAFFVAQHLFSRFRRAKSYRVLAQELLPRQAVLAGERGRDRDGPLNMAKSKNHTAHNQSRKNHRNGIKKAPKSKANSKKGQDSKMVRNSRFAVRGNIAKRQGDAAWEKYVEERDAARERRGA